MDKTLKIEVSREEAAEFEANIHHYFREIEQSHKRMEKIQTEISKLKASTRKRLAKLEAA